MREALLDLLRCPFCGGALTVVENQALRRANGVIEAGVLGCDCCAYPVVEGIPVLVADDPTRDAMHQLEAGEDERALLTLLGLDEERGARVRDLLRRGTPPTYREALPLLCLDAEAENFLYRLTDPTYLTAEALLQSIAQAGWPFGAPVLDVCGGSGHLTRVLDRLRASSADPGDVGVVDADVYFWKLWMARRITAPGCEAVCCDGNSPLPFTRDAFSLVLLADAFPYIWHKRLLADEMTRVARPAGVIVMPHLHSSLGENFSAGMTLSPERYRDLFAAMEPRLFSDARLLDDVLERRVVDLTLAQSAEGLGAESSFTLVASPRSDLFERYEVPESRGVSGELAVNPLYRVARRNGGSVLTLTFPTTEYEEEFGECKRYLPPTVTVAADLTRPFTAAALGPDYEDLRRRHVIIDAPRNYC